MDSDKIAASMGSVWIRLDNEHTPADVVPKRRLSMGSIRTHEAGGSSKPCKTTEPKIEIIETPSRCNRSSKSCRTVEPMNQIDTTPSRRITRSSKRPVEDEVADHSTKRRKLVKFCLTQESVYFIEPENRVSASINVFFKEDVISDLNNILTTSQKEIFSRTCFGHFLRMSYIRLQHQTIHKMLLMEVMQPNQNEMWFKVAGNLLRFSIQEFCMVTGLRCAGEDNLNSFKTGDCRLKRKYFGNIKNVYRKDVEQKFQHLPQNTPDDDVVKLGILYLVSSFLYTSPQPTMIKHELMRIIDSPHMDTFPWGKELYQNTHFYMNLALEKPKQMECDPKSIISYRLYGFPLAFQIWIYESIPLLSGVVCNRVSRTFPRILNWSTDDSRVSAADLDKKLYDLDVVEVNGTQPCEVELRAGYFVGLHIKEPTFKAVNTRRTDPEVVKVLPHDVKGKHKASTSGEHFVHCSKRNTRDVSYQREPRPSYEQLHVLKLLGELQYHVLGIQDKQTEIINLQNAMKLDIQLIERSVEDKYECLMEEIKRKNHGEYRDDGNAAFDISKRMPVATETEAREHVGYGNTSNNDENDACPDVETVATADENNLLGQTDHPIGCEKSSKTIALATDIHDDIHFTEEELIQVDHIVNSVQSMKHKTTLQAAQFTVTANMSSKLDMFTHDISKKLFHRDTTPNCLNKESRPVECCIPATPKAPMMVGESAQNVLLIEPGDQNTDNAATPTENKTETSFHSAYNTVGLINTPGTNINTNYRAYAIKEGMAPPHVDDVEAFESWFQEGYKAGQIKFKFPPSKDILNPPLQFGPYAIDRKTWWYELRQPKVSLKDTHLNVCSYYFRKMVKYSKLITFNGTTTDSFFGSMVRAAYKSCSKDINAISNSRSLVEYARGEYMHCNTNWCDVDHVIIPIMMDKKAHWILGHFDIKRRCLNIYNPDRLTIRDRMVSNDVEAFTYVLPCLMLKIGAWQASPADRIGLVTPLNVNIVTDIPHDDSGHECGLYVIRFAEYIINGIIDKVSWKFDPNEYRISLASQLLKHGCDKVIEAYDTDFDLVPRSVRRDRKMKGLMIE